MVDKKTVRREDINKKVDGAHRIDPYGMRGGVQAAPLSPYANTRRIAEGQEKLRKTIKEKWQRKTSY